MDIMSIMTSTIYSRARYKITFLGLFLIVAVGEMLTFTRQHGEI